MFSAQKAACSLPLGGSRLYDTQEVTGSSPVWPTSSNPRAQKGLRVFSCARIDDLSLQKELYRTTERTFTLQWHGNASFTVVCPAHSHVNMNTQSLMS